MAARDSRRKKSFDYAALTPEAQTSYDLWIYQLQQAEAARPFRANAYIFDQMSAIHGFFPQLLIAFHRVEDVADMEAYINRIRESGRALQQLIAISKQNAAAGGRPPRFSFDFVIELSSPSAIDTETRAERAPTARSARAFPSFGVAAAARGAADPAAGARGESAPFRGPGGPPEPDARPACSQ